MSYSSSYSRSNSNEFNEIEDLIKDKIDLNEKVLKSKGLISFDFDYKYVTYDIQDLFAKYFIEDHFTIKYSNRAKKELHIFNNNKEFNYVYVMKIEKNKLKISIFKVKKYETIYKDLIKIEKEKLNNDFIEIINKLKINQGKNNIFVSTSFLISLKNIRDYLKSKNYKIIDFDEDEKIIVSIINKQNNDTYEYKYRIENINYNEKNYNTEYSIKQIGKKYIDDKKERVRNFSLFYSIFNEKVAKFKESNENEIEIIIISNYGIINNLLEYYKDYKKNNNNITITDKKDNLKYIITENIKLNEEIEYNIKIIKLNIPLPKTKKRQPKQKKEEPMPVILEPLPKTKKRQPKQKKEKLMPVILEPIIIKSKK